MRYINYITLHCITNSILNLHIECNYCLCQWRLFCHFDCWYFIHQCDHDDWRSQDLWLGGPVISQLQCLPNATQVNTISICILYSYFPISSLLKFFGFQIVSPRTPGPLWLRPWSWSLKNYKPNWNFGRARHWNSDTRQFVSPSSGDDLDPQFFTLSLCHYMSWPRFALSEWFLVVL